MATSIASRPNSSRKTSSANNSGTSRKTDRRSTVDAKRVQRLLETEIDFIPNESFQSLGIERDIPREDELLSDVISSNAKELRSLPGHLARLCEAPLLTADEEMRLFRRMNYLKYKATTIRSELNPSRPSKKKVLQAEDALQESAAIRDRILQSNTRLVMSIVKKFVTPQQSFDELLSDGIFSLMQAAEKFDYDRGFRFSTYAYRAIARNTYRKINDRQKENTRYALNSEEAVLGTADECNSSSVYDEAWDRLRRLLGHMMDRLDRRERFIIRSRYALGAHRKVRTFQCLADKLGVSKERVRQLEQRAVAKLQAFASEEPTEELAGPVFS